MNLPTSLTNSNTFTIHWRRPVENRKLAQNSQYTTITYIPLNCTPSEGAAKLASVTAELEPVPIELALRHGALTGLVKVTAVGAGAVVGVGTFLPSGANPALAGAAGGIVGLLVDEIGTSLLPEAPSPQNTIGYENNFLRWLQAVKETQQGSNYVFPKGLVMGLQINANVPNSPDMTKLRRLWLGSKMKIGLKSSNVLRVIFGDAYDSQGYEGRSVETAKYRDDASLFFTFNTNEIDSELERVE